MDEMDRVCLSTIYLDQQGAQEGSGGEINNPSDSAGLGVPTVVPSAAGLIGELPYSPTNATVPAHRPVRPTSPTNDIRPASSNRMDTIQGEYTAAGISTEAAQLLLSGCSRGTNTTFQSAWKKWASWCIPRKIDPLLCPVHLSIDFLAGLFSAAGLQYRIIRSAVSITHDEIEGVSLGQHPLVSHFL